MDLANHPGRRPIEEPCFSFVRNGGIGHNIFVPSMRGANYHMGEKAIIKLRPWALSFCRGLLLAVMGLITFAGPANARRAIPDDNLAYPVLVTLRGTNFTSLGSGFYLNTDDAVYFVTARHVLLVGLLPDPTTHNLPSTDLELLSYSKDLPNPSRIVLEANLSVLSASGNVKIHPSQDVMVIKIGTISPNPANPSGRSIAFSPGIIMKESGGTGLLGAALSNVLTFDKVLVGNDVILYGYPVSLGIRENPQFDSTRPLLRKGLVAGQDFLKKSIILDCPSYRGNSGGPVFQIEPDGFTFKYELIGVVTEFIPLSERSDDFIFSLNSGYSVAKPMDFVLELIK
jgi:hypothetical protein